MAVNIAQLVAETKKSKFSLIPSLSENDVLSVWDGVSDFIEKQMLQQKGVCIHSFGTFTFSQSKLELGGNKAVMIQRPVFVLSEKMAQTHGISYQKHHQSGTIPILPLNYTVLANGTPWDRPIVETCVRELLLCLSRLLALGKTVELDFTGVGRLLLRGKRIKMKFFKEFIRSLDNSGSIKTNMFGQYSRSGTSDSSSSIMTTPDKPSATALVLPKIVEASTQEETNGKTAKEEAGGLALASTEDPLPAPTSNSPPLSASFSDKQESKALKKAQHKKSSSDKLTGLVESHKRQSTAPHGSLRKSLPNSLTSSFSGLPAIPASDSRPMTTCSHRAQSAGQDLCYLCHQRNERNKPVMVDDEKRAMEEMEDKMLYEYLCTKDKHSIAVEKAKMASNRQVEEEMAQFNLKVCNKRKQQRKYEGLHYSDYHPSYVFQHRPLTPHPLEKQEEYRSQLDSQVTFKQSKIKKMTEEEKQADLLEHNKLVQELAVLDEKHHQAKAAKKREYQLALDDQLHLKEELRRVNNLHQCKHKGLRQKRTHSGSASSCSECMLPKSILAEIVTGCRQEALGALLKVKKKNLKDLTLNSQPVFCVKNISPEEKLQEERERASSFCKEHLAAMDMKQKLKKEKVMRTKERDAEILMNTRKELLQDIAATRRDKYLARSNLEKEWLENIKQKEANLAKESQHANAPSILVHDQCRRYHRCRQCQRRRNNYGHSNVFSESRYISGSRLMV